MTPEIILDIKDLSISFGRGENSVEVVNKISFNISENEILGVVGESGSGKSVTAMSIMGLLPKKTSQIKGAIFFNGTDILKEKSEVVRALRGKKIAMIFQEPMSALNPSLRCGLSSN